jgi:hypothetical protein
MKIDGEGINGRQENRELLSEMEAVTHNHFYDAVWLRLLRQKKW